jgi:uncharacterized membrane protein
MNKIFEHLKKYIIRGILATIPLALTYFALMILYNTIDQRAVKLVDKLIGFSFPGLGLILVLVSLYLLGLIASNFVGKKTFNLLEKITNRIPLINTVYKIGHQLGTTLSLPGKQVFKKAVLVEYLKQGTWTIGFVTGTLIDENDDSDIILKVFVPTPPNPTTGTIIIVKESQTRNPGWTVEEALRTVLSGGIIGPEKIG